MSTQQQERSGDSDIGITDLTQRFGRQSLRRQCRSTRKDSSYLRSRPKPSDGGVQGSKISKLRTQTSTVGCSALLDSRRRRQDGVRLLCDPSHIEEIRALVTSIYNPREMLNRALDNSSLIDEVGRSWRDPPGKISLIREESEDSQRAADDISLWSEATSGSSIDWAIPWKTSTIVNHDLNVIDPTA